MRRRVIVFVASAAYLGYAPVASGTFGTLAGVALFPLLHALRLASTALYLVTFAGLVAAAIWVAGEAEGLFAEHDSGKITIDEVAGYATATLFVTPSLATLVASFLLFRLFDVVKPWPARWIDRELPGGAGVVLDDVFAGLYANLSLRLLFAGLSWSVS
jgi:phosphatidylglycerophosphatase A